MIFSLERRHPHTEAHVTDAGILEKKSRFVRSAQIFFVSVAQQKW